MATKVQTSIQLALIGRHRLRTVFKFAPGEYQRLRDLVTVQTCDLCEAIQAVAFDRGSRYESDMIRRWRYTWERTYHTSPWGDKETMMDMICEHCEDTGRNDGDFAPEYCDGCSRYIIQRNPANGYRSYFIVYRDESICVRCYQEKMMAHGLEEEDLEDGNLSCDFYTESELLAAGFDEGRSFQNGEREELIIEYVRACRANGNIVLFDQGRTGIGSGPDDVTAWTKAMDGERTCLEHHEDGGDPLHAQHHSPEDHEGSEPCRCGVYKEVQHDSS